MINQAKIISDWCEEEGFNFVNCNEEGIKLPCSLDKDYRENNHTLFIQGFYKGSRKIGYSRGGLKCILTLKVPVEELVEQEIKEQILPTQWKCDKCEKRNLNLKTQDNHKTYDCPDCYKNDTPPD